MNKYLSRYFFYYPATLARGECVAKYLKQYESLQWKSREEIANFQLRALNRLLKHAADSVPFYTDLFRETNFAGRDIENVNQLHKLPILDKPALSEHGSDLFSSKRFFYTCNKTTGGSTGQAVTIRKNADALARERAATWRAYRWAGVEIGDIQARFWGTPLSRRGRVFNSAVDYISNRTRLSAFNINEQSLDHYYRELQKVRPAYLYGYVSMILAFANHIRERNYRPYPWLKSIITTSEVLDDHTRSVIESTFGAKVFNEYGCGEVGSIAHECEHGSMHIMADNVIVQIEGENDGADSGEIIVTDLHNYAMPLIRYRVGDYATLSHSACACGRGLPVIEKIHGRAYDIIRDTEGNRYHPEILMYIFEDLKTRSAAIKQFQVVQEDTDILVVNLVTGDSYKEDMERTISDRIHNDIHPDFRLKFNYVDTISREASGKLRVIKSCLPGS